MEDDQHGVAPFLWDKTGEAFGKNIGGRPLGVALSQSKGPDRSGAGNLFLHREHFLALARRPGWGEFKGGFIFHKFFSALSVVKRKRVRPMNGTNA
jgi:hypothetical protein